MKTFRLVLAVLMLLCVSLSSGKVARADWELDHNEMYFAGLDGFYQVDLYDFSESIVELGGAFSFSSRPETYLDLTRNRQTRVFYKWTGPGTPTPIQYVDVSYFMNRSVTTDPYSNGNYYTDAFVFGTTLSGLGVSSTTGTTTTSVAFSSPTEAFIDVYWGYHVELSPDAGAVASGSVGVGFGTGTPYY